MSPNEYQDFANRSAPSDAQAIEAIKLRLTYYPNLIHAAFGINTESGELMDTIKKTAIYGKPLDFANVEEELGDLLWYIALAATSIGAHLDDIMKANIEKLKIRYPEKFTEKDALERKDKHQ